MRADRRALSSLASGLIALLVPLASLVGCPQTPAPPASATPGAAPARIVSLAPSITETLFAIGAGERVAAVTAHCDWPAAALEKPRVGGYNAPNVELVLAARPDLVIVPREGANRGPFDRLRALGVRVEDVRVTSLDELAPSIERVAALAGRPEEGRALAASVTARIEAVRRAVAGRPLVKTLLAVDHDPLIAAGRETFGDDLIRAAGGLNVASQALSSYPQLGLEAILSAAPAVIVEAGMAPGDAAMRSEAARLRWARHAEIPAVRDGRVVAIDPDLVVRPGPRLVEGLEALARLLHPGALP